PFRSGPWNIPAEILGPCYAYHVLLHECVHVSVDYLLGGFESHPDYRTYWTSHNNPLWVGECNRIAALMGLPANFQMKTYHRVDTDRTGSDGRPKRKQVYAAAGPDFERFPYGTPGATEFYLAKRLPFAWPGGEVNTGVAAAAGQTL